MRAIVTVSETPALTERHLVSCFLTARGWVHVSDLTPVEAFDLGPQLTGAEVLQLRSHLARLAVARRIVHDVTNRTRRAA
jgi:hypothetical protein